MALVLHIWWRHQMETLSALLAICVGNSPVTGEFPTQRPVTRSFDVFFDLRLNERLSKQSWGWLFEAPSRPLWRRSNVNGPRVGLYLNTLRPRKHGRHFPGDIFICIFLNEYIYTSTKFSLKFIPKGPIYNIPSLVQIMAWRRSADKPLSEPMMVDLLTHICITRPQWVYILGPIQNKMVVIV